MAEKQFHEMEPGELRENAREIAQPFIDGVVKQQCELYDLSHDSNHLWRAWRAARAAGDISPFCLHWLMPRLDKLARLPENETHAEWREERNSCLLDYYHELVRMEENREGCARNKTQIRRWVAERHDTDEGVIKQHVIKYEREQRKQRIRNWARLPLSGKPAKNR